jgi:hypothetical protein
VDLSRPVTLARIRPEHQLSIFFLAGALHGLSARIDELRRTTRPLVFTGFIGLRRWRTAFVPVVRSRRAGIHCAIEIWKGILGYFRRPKRRFEKNLVPRVSDLDNQVFGPFLAIDESEGGLEILPVAPWGTDCEMSFAQRQELTINAGQAHFVHDRKRIEAKTHEHRTREQDGKQGYLYAEQKAVTPLPA